MKNDRTDVETPRNHSVATHRNERQFIYTRLVKQHTKTKKAKAETEKSEDKRTKQPCRDI